MRYESVVPFMAHQTRIPVFLGHPVHYDSNFAVILEDIKTMKNKIESLTSSAQDQETRLFSLGTRGTWCASQNEVSATGTIRYDRLTFSDTNMEITRTPLSYSTGNCSNT